MNIDPARLYTALLNTGLQQKDNRLYQVIYQLISMLSNAVSNISGITSGTVVVPIPPPVNVYQVGYWTPLTDGDVDETDLIFADGDAIMVWVPTP